MDHYSDPGPVPPVGANKEFDRHVQETFGDIGSSAPESQELRRAAWATWRTKEPTAPTTRQTSEDDDLARAIAMSVQDQQSGAAAVDDELTRALALSVQEQGSSTRPIVIDDDDDDDEIQLVMAISAETAAAEARRSKGKGKQVVRSQTPNEEKEMLEQVIAASVQDDSEAVADRRDINPKRIKLDPKLESSRPQTSSSVTSVTQSAGPAGLLGIDRAQLERERLARQEARLRPEAQPAPTVPSISSVAMSPQVHGKRHPLQLNEAPPRDSAGEYYPDGELRHVALQIGDQSSEKTFSIQDVFANRSQMSLVIVSSFAWDPDWFPSVLPDPAIVPSILVMPPQTSDYTQKSKLQGKLQPLHDGSICVFPDMDGKRGVEHMKYAWIFYKTGRLRVAIMTANLMDFDYESIENTIFIQDFLPKGRTLRGDVNEAPSSNLPDFPDQFSQLFRHLKIYKAIRRLAETHPNGQHIPISADESFAEFDKYDWSKVRVRLVMSIPGVYRGFDKMSERGICRVAKVVEEEGWGPGKGERVVAEYQGSSLGSYSLPWYSTFYDALSGMSLANMSRQKPLSWPPLKVIFPSLATVDASIGKRPGGGTMFCGSSFEKHPELFHDANSKRGGVLMHTKMLIVTFEKQPSVVPIQSEKRKADEMDNSKSNSVGGWIYVGSHNFSPSAWGTINFKNTPATLNINNYELGIMFPLPRGHASAVADLVAPHKRPPRPYGKKDVAWSQVKHGQ